ncbi:GDSL esterase/lipase At5g42170 [Helianthus annuus]|uniref:GDSL esterase/lipase At5g42170 n=1 Tax=Helianthus annuus TaxID=4232 RepID=UPI000B8FBE73|nr:GDSL esterase/lipase At5g42170 [Helianthus annuus]
MFSVYFFIIFSFSYGSHSHFLVTSVYLHGNGATYLPDNVSVPAIIAFGDSLLDPGNNNRLMTFTKANFPPYGKDFVGGKPTGRFTNGKTLGDFLAKGFGVKEYLPAYLDPSIKDSDLLTGVSFASGGSGYDPLTSTLAVVIPLSVQLEMFKKYISKLKIKVGEEQAKHIIANSVYFISAGSNDFLTNYYIYPIRRLRYDVFGYGKMLVKFAMDYIQEIHKLGARRIVVFSTPPLGCIPIERTIAGGLHRKCVDKYNKAAQLFNSMLKQEILFLAGRLPETRVAMADLYNPLISIIENPHQYGLEVTDRGCCGIGIIEMSFSCNKLSKLCRDDSKFLFWDSLHPTEKGCDIYINLILPNLLKSLF